MKRRFFRLAWPCLAAVFILLPLVDLTAALSSPLPSSQPTVGALLEEADRCLRAAEHHQPGDRQIALYRKAEGLAEQALVLSPESADAHFVHFAARGSRFLADGPSKSLFQLPALKKSLARAIELNPRHAHALAAQGGMLIDLPYLLGGDPQRAKRYLERAIELNPTGPGTRISMAKVLLYEGDREGARHNLRLAGHYAWLSRRPEVLTRADEMLAELER